MISDNKRHIQLFFNISQYRWVCFFFFFSVLAVYGRVSNHQFIDYDDNVYIIENDCVRKGLTPETIRWAFTTVHASNWHPLTWLSHQADAQIYGMNPGLHHITAMLFHIANTILLFSVLTRMTGALWRSAFVAALFALHPLHVESVAWVSERKDVLSTFFWMLTLRAYVSYTKHSVTSRYILILFLFALGLMAKPMVITLPFILLLLDYWPLKREMTSSIFYEKLPMIGLSLISAAVTIFAQQHGGAINSLETYPVHIRIMNALISYAGYMKKMFYPVGLSGFYPHPGNSVSLLCASGAFLLFGVISAVAIWRIKAQPYLTVGWLWYIGTLIPVIGLVQVGNQAMADRYTYIPLIGLFVMIAWGIPDFLSQSRYMKAGILIAVPIIIFMLTAATWKQIRYWRDNFTFFTRMLEVTPNNYMALHGLGLVLANQGKLTEAIAYYRESLSIEPGYGIAHNNLGLALLEQGHIKDAIAHFEQAIRSKLDNSKFHNNLGVALAKEGRTAEAVDSFREALRMKPDYAGAYYNLANTLKSHGKMTEAILYFQKAVSVNPDFANAHYNLATTLAAQGNTREAIIHFLKALEITPDDADAHIQLGILLMQQGFIKEAAAHFLKSLEIRPDTAGTVHNNLGVALSHEGKIKEASLHFQKALQINPDNAEARNNLEKIKLVR